MILNLCEGYIIDSAKENTLGGDLRLEEIKICYLESLWIDTEAFKTYIIGCESRTTKKAEHQRIDASKLWSWRRLLRVPWTARRSNQSPKGDRPWIFMGRTDAEAEAPILWLPDVKSWLFEKDPDAGKDLRQKERRWQRMRWLGSITNSVDVNLGKLRETVKDRET